MRKIIAVSGIPGVGKTTLFRKFISKFYWEEISWEGVLPCLYCKEIDTYILGKYESGVVFAGTDRLSMSIQPIAQRFFNSTESNVIFEGDRLTNRKFFSFLSELKDSSLEILILTTSNSILIDRYSERGSNQSDTFLKGRATKISNILMDLELREYISEFNNNTFNEQQKIIEHIVKSLNA